MIFSGLGLRGIQGVSQQENNMCGPPGCLGHSSGSGRGSESMEGRSDLTRLQQRFLLCLWLHDARLLHQATR